MYDFHHDKKTYFRMQNENAREYVIPFIEKVVKINVGMIVLEIGCAEGGVLKAFLDLGCRGVGVELSSSRADLAREFLKKEIAEHNCEIISKDIYDLSSEQGFKNAFDIIILKDVIEHIHDQKKLMKKLKEYLKPDGKIFFGFPPWQMPFGGHQQICKNKLLAALPYYHLLPKTIYKGVLKSFGEKNQTISDLLEVKETGISIERFERLLISLNYRIDNKTFYFINPIYKYKFGWKGRKQNKIISSIPWMRNLFTTAVYYLVSVK